MNLPLKDNEHVKIQGICGKGFWLRFFINGKQRTEEFVYANCVPQDAEHYATYFNNVIQTHIGNARLFAKSAEKSEGSLIVYKEIDGRPNGFPVFGLATEIEHFYPVDGDVEVDAPTRIVYDVQNKFAAVDALLQSIMADLELLSDVHFDDNAKELALAISAQVEKMADDFDEKVNNPVGDWRTESLHGVLYYFTRNHHQAMVIPEMRRNYYQDIAKDDSLTAEEKDAEVKSWIAAVRAQFKLSSDWK